MFKRTCVYCHVITEAETLDELGLKIDEEHVRINEERRNDKSLVIKYKKELKEFERKRNDLVGELQFNPPSKEEKVIIFDDEDGYSIGALKTKVVDEVKHLAPEPPTITILAEKFIECKVCGYKYYLDGSNIFGFPR